MVRGFTFVRWTEPSARAPPLRLRSAPMRNSWVRDIADFAKYGILKRLVGDDLRLGVVWYLTAHASGRSPLVAYLRRRADYAPCDPVLFDALYALNAERGDRAVVGDVEQRGILFWNTIFFANPLATAALAPAERGGARGRWFSDATKTVRDSDVVFLDPDTGLIGLSSRTAKRDEYALIDEVKRTVDSGRSVVCVQFGRPGNLEKQPSLARARMKALADVLVASGHPKPFGLWWRDTHKVGFIIAPSKNHAATLRERAASTLAHPAWRSRLSEL